MNKKSIVYVFVCLLYKYYMYIMYVGESNRIRTVLEYAHSQYIRNHKSYKKNVNEKHIHNYINSLKK